MAITESQRRCLEKQRYPQRKHADAAARVALLNRVRVAPYKCRECDGYHLTKQIFNHHHLRELQRLMTGW